MTKDEAFIKRLRATFQAEAAEHLQAISSLLLELEKSPPPAQRTAAIETAYREAHSLKGASRAVDLSDIEAICQAVEGVFSTWKQTPPSISAEVFDTLHQALDSIRQIIESTQTGSAALDRPRRDQLIENLGQLQSPAAHSVAPAPAPPPRLVPIPEVERSAAAETVRIPIAKLDAQLLQAEELLTLKASTAQRAAEIRELTGLFDRWWKEWARVASEVRALRRGTTVSGSEALVHFLDWNGDYLRSLESRLASLWTRADQDRRGLSKRVDDLLEESKKLLMLPFSTIGDLFSKLVRDLCRDQGKEADVTIEGGEVGIDKRILEEMKDAITHILRNCVDHGVERPEERARLNKPPRAAIKIAVRQVNGDKVEIQISDDGAGVETAKVKKAAISRGVISEDESRVLKDEDALPLIFHSGVSTSSMITQISGRGLGMAIARAKAEKLGGRIAVQSQPHAGTTVRITLPLTLATFRGILVSVGDHTFVMPTASVERVLRVQPSEIRTVENRETISVQGRAVSLARLDAVLGLAAKEKRGDGSAAIPVLVLHAAEQRIAFAVDAVQREEEVLVKPFRKPLARVRNVAGATVLGAGKLAPVLNVADLMKSAAAHGAVPAAATKAIGERPASLKRILVVEDSITSRTLLKGILETANYQVKTAVDGVDAFTALREEQFDLVVSDVEMPRMNGLDLTARIRADDRLKELPVVLVTALESRQERERGIDVGANAYISKSSFDQSNLLEVVRRFV
jgi:two-component system, chemotaxis family, sensor kinase CheA